jgi:AcrR family transcriptional regulator
LPRGPHQLSRDQVEASQRTRLLDAMADVVADKGYARIAVADVLRRSGVSRRTFYEMFGDKEACFLAALDARTALLQDVLAGSGAARQPDPLARLDSVLGAYLEALACEPAGTRTFLVEIYAAGPRALDRRRSIQQSFVDIVASIFARSPGLLGDRPEQRFATEAFVGAISSMVTSRVAAGEYDQLPALREPLVALARDLIAPRG